MVCAGGTIAVNVEHVAFVQGHFREQCTGKTQQDAGCSPCTVGGCGYNQYRPVCDGLFTTSDSQCLTCSTAPCSDASQFRPVCDGAVDTQDSKCTNCQKTCGPGEYIVSTCTVSGYKGAVCAKCRSSCQLGERLSGTCDGKGSSDLTCLPCKNQCGEGQYLGFMCSGKTVEVCIVLHIS
jgi:hypothetical protein